MEKWTDEERKVIERYIRMKIARCQSPSFADERFRYEAELAVFLRSSSERSE